MNDSRGVISEKFGRVLIIICCLTYASAYLGRLSYSANITAIAADMGVTKDALGLVGTYMFFAYGAGQLVHFFLAKYYNPKPAVPLAAVGTAVCNYLMTVATDVSVMKIIWMINGICQSFFWCNVCNMQARYLRRSQIAKCVMWLGFSYCFGTFAVYAISAVFVGINWRISFYTYSAIIAAVAVAWVIMSVAIGRAKLTDDETEPASDIAATDTVKPTKLYTGYFCRMLSFVALVSVIMAFIRDGVIMWFPTMLKDKFGLADGYAVTITMAVALMSTVGIYMAKAASARIHGYLRIMGLALFSISVAFAAGILFYNLDIEIGFIVAFAVAVCFIYCVGNVITGKIPFGVRKYGNVGGLSAMLDAFCYLGSSIATYTFGAVAEKSGWTAVLIMISVISVIGGVSALIGSHLVRRDSLTDELL